MPETQAPDGPSPRARGSRGRPRSAHVEAAILKATVELLTTSGLDGTTIQAIADRAQVARATIYLRWATREALITAALRHAIGRQPFPLTGDIEADLRLGAEQAQWVFSQPVFASVLPALVREFVRADQANVTFDMLFVNRRRGAEEYDRLAGSQGFREDIEGTVVVDALIGALLVHFLANGAPPTKYREQLLDLLLAGGRGSRDPSAS